MSSELLVFSQWQGYAADDRPQRGAHAIAAALDERTRVAGSGAPDGAGALPRGIDAAPRSHAVDVPAWHPLDGELAAGEAGGRVLGLHEIVTQAASALRWLEATAPARLLVIGGDCGSDFAPITWQAARHGSRLGVLYLDAHADLNTPASSPSARFHGMVLRAVLGEAAPALRPLCSRPLATSQIIMAGVRDLDPAERDFLDAADLRPLSPAAITDGSALAAVQAHPATCWHVHLDLDVLDPDDFPDVTVPTPGGPTLEAVTRMLVELVRSRDVVSLTVTEHVGGDASARRVADLVAALQRAGWGG